MNDVRDLHDDEAFEALLRSALDRSGQRAPFAVDVADAVMARVSADGPAPTAEMGWRQITRWAIAAAAIGVALLAAAAWHGPTLGEIVQDLGRTTAGTAGTVAKLSEPAGRVAATFGRTALALMDAARTLSRPLNAMTPLAEAMLAAVAAAMIAITTFVVGRDLRTVGATKEQA